MATIKTYTDLEQSKILEDILPLSSADMCYINNEAHLGFLYEEYKEFGDTILQNYHPCWSLAALLNFLPAGTRLLKSETDATYHCDCPTKGNIDRWYDNPIDAAFELIVKFHEQNLWNNI